MTLQMNNSSIDTIIEKIITTWEEKLQLDFLKMHPAFKLKYGILSYWISIYREFSQYQSKSITDLNQNLDHKEKIEKTKELLLNRNSNTGEFKKKNMFNFLINGFDNNFIPSEPRDIMRILGILEEAKEDIRYINSVKLYLTKCHITDDIIFTRKAISERKVKEMLPKQRLITASAKSFVDIIIKDIDCINPKDIALELTRDNAEILNKINIIFHNFTTWLK